MSLQPAEIEFAPGGFDDETAPVSGAVDYVDHVGGISGWALALDGDQNPVQVEVTCAGELLAVTYADLSRPDISSVLGRDVDCGFRFAWDDFDRDVVASLRHLVDQSLEFFVGGRIRRLLNAAGDLTVGDVQDYVSGEPAPADVISALDVSPLFDHTFYNERAGLRRDRKSAIHHYVRRGEAENIPPSEAFDVSFYRSTARGIPPNTCLLHYHIRAGRREARYTNRRTLAADAGTARGSGLFDQKHFFDNKRWPADPLLTDIEQHLAFAWREGSWANHSFDDSFYWSTYPDVRESGRPPLVHFVEHGQYEWRVTNRASLDQMAQAINTSFDANFYRAQHRDFPQDADPVTHYLTIGLRKGYRPAKYFLPKYYLRRYPDIRKPGFEPFAHFLHHGRAEDRVGSPDFRPLYREGQRSHDPAKQTILVVTHQASRTGAPLLALLLGERLEHNYNVVHLTGAEGSLFDAMLESSMCVAAGDVEPMEAPYLMDELRQDWQIDAVLLNSVETVEFAEAALEVGLPSVALVHEFSEYSLPRGKVARMISLVDVAITPAQTVLASAKQEMLRHFEAAPTDILVRTQGKLPRLPPDHRLRALSEAEILERIGAAPGAKPRIVLGAGHVQIRKGVDVFIQTAAEVKRRFDGDFRFIWVGADYRPLNDMTYGVWLATDLRQAGLEDTVFFFDQQSDLDAFFSLADVFYLSSRLDPFPNVAIDAFTAGKYVVCFDRGTGVAEPIAEGLLPGVAVASGSAAAAAEAIVRRLAESPPDAAVDRRAAEELFDFGRYAEFVDAQMVKAAVLRDEAADSCDGIAESGAFDAAFNLGLTPPLGADEMALRKYVAWGRKGLLKLNPRPGFHDGLYRSRNAVGNAAPLEHALRHASGPAGAQPSTHRCVILGSDIRPRPPGLSAAIHLHLFYSDLAFEFAEALSKVAAPFDVFVTTTTPQSELEIRYAFRNFAGGAVQTMLVPNKGRDLGPFLVAMAEPIAEGGYDVVGHLHGKRSPDLQVEGEKWRAYLTENLLGTPETFRQLLGLFEDEPEFGLVFAEDRHTVGWSTNAEAARAFAERLSPRPELPDYPCFPLGNMFWARPAALGPVFDLKLDWDDFPAEPVPYDGTFLHALERMWPSIAEAAGYRWATVYKPRSAW